jgi:hypothetical protein
MRLLKKYIISITCQMMQSLDKLFIIKKSIKYILFNKKSINQHETII